jgi:hypothetical protein
MIAGPVNAQKAKVVATPKALFPSSAKRAGCEVASLKKLAVIPEATKPITVQ